MHLVYFPPKIFPAAEIGKAFVYQGGLSDGSSWLAFSWSEIRLGAGMPESQITYEGGPIDGWLICRTGNPVLPD
jgi:hypothetical protein